MTKGWSDSARVAGLAARRANVAKRTLSKPVRDLITNVARLAGETPDDYITRLLVRELINAQELRDVANGLSINHVPTKKDSADEVPS